MNILVGISLILAIWTVYDKILFNDFDATCGFFGRLE